MVIRQQQKDFYFNLRSPSSHSTNSPFQSTRSSSNSVFILSANFSRYFFFASIRKTFTHFDEAKRCAWTLRARSKYKARSSQQASLLIPAYWSSKNSIYEILLSFVPSCDLIESKRSSGGEIEFLVYEKEQKTETGFL